MSSAADQVFQAGSVTIAAGGESAAVRSAVYALCSELVGSPFDLPEGTSLAASAAELVELLPALPYPLELPELTLAELDTQLNDTRRCRRQYSGLFAVGDRVPPIAIRESQAVAPDTGVEQRLVRLFEFFGYPIAEQHARACDHIAVELAFMHWFCFQEAQVSDSDQRSSYQHAQRDFLAGHVLNWLPDLVRQVGHMAPSGPYNAVFRCVHALAAADLAYRDASLSPAGGES